MKKTIIPAIIIITSIVFNSPFQKGGPDTTFIFYIFTFPLINLFVILPIKELTVKWKLITFIAVTLISTFLSTLIITMPIVDWYFNSKTWFLWESPQRQLTNILNFSSAWLISWALIKIVRKVKLYTSQG
jgi:hypothetical protein|tara:strand:+ start:270 stop:659 length:390 start_codon:yes stop_codon:yes gene_type:complete